MNKEDIQDLKDILKLLEKAKFDGLSMVSQMNNVKLLQKFTNTVVKLEQSLEPMKIVEDKNTMKQSQSGKK